MSFCNIPYPRVPPRPSSDRHSNPTLSYMVEYVIILKSARTVQCVCVCARVYGRMSFMSNFDITIIRAAGFGDCFFHGMPETLPALVVLTKKKQTGQRFVPMLKYFSLKLALLLFNPSRLVAAFWWG